MADKDITERLWICGCCDSHEAADEIERLRAERDEARRMWCEEIRWARGGVMSVELIARECGWDCFKENTNV